MLFRIATLRGIVDGSVTLAFRRWDRPRAKVGGETRTALGVVVVDAVEEVELDSLTEADATAAGFASLAALVKEFHREPQRHPDGAIYRITLHLGGPDPRVALRVQADLDDEELATVLARLDRLDKASKHGAWTQRTLELIQAQPATCAADLAAGEGRETAPFKLDVRKLKNLGLTESLEVGYRVSPRGQAILRALTP